VAAGLVAIFAAFLALMIGMKGRAFAPVAV